MNVFRVGIGGEKKKARSLDASYKMGQKVVEKNTGEQSLVKGEITREEDSVEKDNEKSSVTRATFFLHSACFYE